MNTRFAPLSLAWLLQRSELHTTHPVAVGDDLSRKEHVPGYGYDNRSRAAGSGLGTSGQPRGEWARQRRIARHPELCATRRRAHAFTPAVCVGPATTTLYRRRTGTGELGPR